MGKYNITELSKGNKKCLRSYNNYLAFYDAQYNGSIPEPQFTLSDIVWNFVDGCGFAPITGTVHTIANDVISFHDAYIIANIDIIVNRRSIRMFRH